MKKTSICFYIHGMAFGGVEKIVNWLYNNLKNTYDISIVTPSSKDKYVLDIENTYFLKEENRNEIYKNLLKIMPDILYVPRSLYNTHIEFFMALSKINKNIKYICGIHIPIKIFNINTTNPIIKNIIYSACDNLHVLSKYDYDNLQKNIKDKTITIENPILTYNNDININNKFRVISAGRFVFEKGYDILLRSIYLLKKEINDIELHIWGNGPEKNKLIQLSKILEIESNVYFHPYQENWLKDTYRTDIFVCSSYYEGYGMALAEAVKNGIPCIAFSNTGGPRNIIRHDFNGILIDGIPLAEKIAESILTLVNNKVKLYEYSKNASDYFKPDYNDIILNKWKELFVPLKEESNIKRCMKYTYIDDEIMSMIVKVKGIVPYQISKLLKRV